MINENSTGTKSYTFTPFSENYACVGDFFEGRACVMNNDGRIGFIDVNGGLAIPMEYYTSAKAFSKPEAHMTAFCGGMARVANEDGRFGYIDKDGECAIPFIFDWALNFECEYAQVTLDGRKAFIDKSGKIAFYVDEIESDAADDSINYDYNNDYTNGTMFDGELLRVRRGGKCGVIDISGKTVIPFEFDEISFDGHGRIEEGRDDAIAVRRGGKWGIYSKTERVRVPVSMEYEKIGVFFDGATRVTDNGKYGLIDRDGKLVIPIKYGNHDVWWNEHHIIAQHGDKTDVFDRDGNLRFVLEGYDYVRFCADGFHVSKNGLCGTLDRDGNEIAPVIHDYFISYDDYAVTRKDGKFGLIDSSGNIILPFEFEELFVPYIEDGCGYITAKRNGVGGIVKIVDADIGDM